MGAALGVAAEAGLMKFGDGDRALELLGEIRKGTPLGRILGHGAAVAGRVLGVLRVPVVKGQAMSAYEPRAIKGTGTTYATSPQGRTTRRETRSGPRSTTWMPRQTSRPRAGPDQHGRVRHAGRLYLCGFGFMVNPEVIPDLLSARYGWQVGSDILQVLGKETISLEREFNRRAGFTAADDRIPEYMRTEPLPPHNSVFDASAEELDSVFNW